MNTTEVLKLGVLPGAIAGLIGGLAFGGAMIELGGLPTIASLVRVDSPMVGFVVHMAIAITIGIGLGLLTLRQRWSGGEVIFWGLAYGAFWWFLGTLTLLPLFLSEKLATDAVNARDQVAALIGHFVYGAAAGVALLLARAVITRSAVARFAPGAYVRGALAGILSAWLMGLALEAQNDAPLFAMAMSEESPGVLWASLLAVGGLAGIGYSLLYPDSRDGTGVHVVRGAAYGFLWWVVAALTVLPLITGSDLDWSLEHLQDNFASFPGYLLFIGAGTAFVYSWLSAAVRGLFGAEVGIGSEEGVGTQGLRRLGQGALAGLIGGALFALVMIQVGFVEDIAGLARASSTTAGLIVHFLIANVIGASYGILFRKHSFNYGSALGWGVSYGFVWWMMGTLTLAPIIVGAPPIWNIDAAAVAFPALISHIAYGAGLGVTFFWLESRHRPWWLSRSELEAQRNVGRREQVLSSAPALWVIMVLVAVTVPILLGGSAASTGGGSIY